MNEEFTTIVDFLSNVEDPRKETSNRRHEFNAALVIALYAMLSSVDD